MKGVGFGLLAFNNKNKGNFMATPDPSQRLGLGLSGGGFRASFYHIGVLAQMAEQGLLRYVEVISTVSGGSIIGALYYLHVKKLLESTADDGITDQDYVNIVKSIEVDFLKATENNIRTATYADFAANFKMVFLNYSRSDRIAELYEQWIYRGVLDSVGDPIQMQELIIQPLGGPDNFRPKTHNADRKAKVPMLVLNATTLNTGRGWEFTAVSMGEPEPGDYEDIIDTKPVRLVWADSYGVMTPGQQGFPLAHAVAASACVPALFDPMAVSGLYYDGQAKQEIRVQLVDGGVYDNQGIEGLLDNGCNCFVISDASGQMGTENDPSPSEPAVIARTNSVLQDVSRTKGLLVLFNLVGRENVAFFNLRQWLEIRDIFWKDQNGSQKPDSIRPAITGAFGFNPEVSGSLAKMRTDLDAFTEVEAYSLMLNGYRMSQKSLEELRSTASCAGVKESQPLETGIDWKFLAVDKWARNPTDNYRKQLKVAQSTFGKALMLMPWLWIPLIALVVLALYFFWPQIVAFANSSISVMSIIIALALWLFNTYAAKLLKLFPFLELGRPQAIIAKNALKAVLLSFGTVVLWLYLKLINPLFLRYGRIANLK